MTCEVARENGLAASYVAGVLTADEMDAYEAHYFGCDACFAEVESLRLTREVLARRPEKPAANSRKIWWGAGIAAAVLAGALTFRPAPPVSAPVAGTTDRALQLVSLAKIELPVYSSVLQRSVRDRAFADAMEFYRKGDCAAAIPRLAPLRTDASRFFSGACLVYAGKSENGIASLREVGGLYEEEAKFLIANAHLRNGDEAKARAELNALVAMQGDWAARARDLLGRVEALR